MLKDRAQKSTALRLCVSKRWLPQLELDVEPTRSLEKAKSLLTDIDVLAVTPSPIGGHGRMVFDCKSGARESAIGRTFWLHGVMTRVSATHGFIILNDKVSIHRDHRISAADLAISLIHECEFSDLAQGIGGSVKPTDAATESIDAWEKLFSLGQKYPRLDDYCRFSGSSYWMIKDHGEQCRKTIARLRTIKGELDPAKTEHLAIFGDCLCLFLLALSEIVNRLFLVLLRPLDAEEFSSSLLSLIYGGYDNLEIAHRVRKLAAGVESEAAMSIFPEIGKFEQLVREILQVPKQAFSASLLARELCLSFITQSPVTSLQREVVAEAPYASKFVFMASEYLQKACRLPPEFSSLYSDAALALSSNSA